MWCHRGASSKERLAATSNGLAAEYLTMLDGCGLWQRPAIPQLILTGEDRQRLLNGLVTCEVKSLAAGQGAQGFFTDAKGHILSPVVVRAVEDHLWLELPGSTVSSISDHIEKYIVADRVEVSVTEALVPLTLVGSGSIRLMDRLVEGQEPPVLEWSHLEAKVGETRVRISESRDLGFPGFTLWVPESSLSGVSQALHAAAGPDGLAVVSDEAIEVSRVEAGAPRFGIDYGTDNLPQETGLDDAVSYTKGCFLGQEVVARLHYRGQVARRISRLEVAAAEPPVAGIVVRLEDRDAGQVTSAVQSTISGKVTALAMLQRRATEPGTELSLEGGGTARVV